MKLKASRVLVIVLITLVQIRGFAVPAEGTRIMTSGPSPHATSAGLEIAEAGGNVVDVAIAMGLALAVTSPYYASLGGGGFALVKMGKSIEALDFREIAPKATSPQFYLDKAKNASMDGALAVGVPGVPAGLWALHKKYGKLHWSRLFKPAIRLANKGFRVSGEWVRITTANKERFNDAGKKRFFKRDGSPYKPGELLVQKDLGKVLGEMSNRNIVSFYSGMVAQDIVNTVKKMNGVITLPDLKGYSVRWLKPIETVFSGHTVYLMPPPSSGGIVIKTALNLVDRLRLAQYQPLSVNELHMLGEVLSRSFRGRALLGDPDFHKNPLDQLLSSDYLKEMAQSIELDETGKLDPLQDATADAKEHQQTTHYSVMDHDGHAVSVTVTLNGNYGSGVVTDRFGIALNNEMDDFTTRPNEPNMFGLIQGKGNVVEPGKRPLSSMSPTIVVKNGKAVMTLGAPGGPRIISAVMQALYRSLVNGFDMDLAIQTPRVHHQFAPHELYVEGKRLSPEVLEGLTKKGHKVTEGSVGKVYGIRLNNKGVLEGAFDSRGEGAAAGF